MLKGPVVLLGMTVAGLVVGLTVVPSLLGLGNVADTACDVCDHRSAAFTTSGVLLPIAASSIAGILLGSLLFWKPERTVENRTTALPARFCTNCGQANEPDWNLCPFCGQSVRPFRESSPRVRGGESRESRPPTDSRLSTLDYPGGTRTDQAPNPGED